MNSWDLWGTLVAGRDPQIRDGDQNSHFPIAENIARVQPQDLVISDYYDKAKAEFALRHVAKLDNVLIVTENGKASGQVWEKLMNSGSPPRLHIGDDPITDVASPKNHGITGLLSPIPKWTPIEDQVSDAGFPGFARLMRETRMATWHEDRAMRRLQLFQAQTNLPFLFFASLIVHRKMPGYKRVLYCARDCYLWTVLHGALRRHCLIGDYEVLYLLTSRLTRYFPSESYKQYFQRQVSVPSLIVDLCGFGRSLKLLENQPGIGTLLLVGYEPCVVPFLIPGWLNETTNFARHPMISDVDEAGQPVYANPLNADWGGIPELREMHETFHYGVSLVGAYDLRRDLLRSEAEAHIAMLQAFSHFDDYVEALAVLTPFRVAEARATADLINSFGQADGIVV